MEHYLKEILESTQFVEHVAWNRRSFNKGEVIVKQGDFGETLFVIEQGVANVSGQTTSTEQETIPVDFCDLEKDSIFGEACLHESSPRIASVTAVTEVQVIEINGAKLSVFLDAHPVLGYLFYRDMFQVFVSRLSNTNQQVENLST